MTQLLSSDTPADTLLQTIDPQGIADASMRQTLVILLNLIEQLKSEVNDLRAENQRLRDENNRLKGEQGKPDIKPKRPKGNQSNHSSEGERKTERPHRKSCKNEHLKIAREQILEILPQQLPADAEFKGYEEVIVQDIKLSTDNVLFRKQKYYSPSEGRTYLAALPTGYEGQFGPNLKALMVSLYFGGNMTQGKLLEFLWDIGISISAGQLSNLLIKGHESFHTEKQEVYQAGLESSSWQHFDQTAARVGGDNYTSNVVCNPWYTVYCTTAKKDRLTVLGVLQGSQEYRFILNQEAFELLKTFNLPQKIIAALKQLPQETELPQATFLELIQTNLPQLGSLQHARVLEAAAIAAYHSQGEWPLVWALVCDDAPQFKLLTPQLGLCWVHEGRHYKKLNPLVACHRQLLDEFLNRYWDYYRQLLTYQDDPCPETARRLREEFHQLFSKPTGYWDLDQRIKLTHAKETELLLVLEHPEVPLHNNPAELAARTMVQRRNISYGTQTDIGTQAWDTFLSLVATTRKLGVSFIAYVRDRIRHSGSIEPLAEMIRQKATANPLGLSWQTDLLISPDC